MLGSVQIKKITLDLLSVENKQVSDYEDMLGKFDCCCVWNSFAKHANYCVLLLLLPNYIHLIIGTAQLQNPKRGKTAW